ncbi:MAG: hypothetical protein E7667_00570 [Ruminococcaceae bacterium]|nr:hypothetical protein [Oscillospiraceae bacterium]
MNFDRLYIVIATLFLLLVCGFVLRKVRIIDDGASKKLSAIVLKVGLPCMLISSISGAEYSVANLKSAAAMIGMGFVFHLLSAAVAFLICKPFRDITEQKVTEFSLVFTNCAFIGFPIFEALFGSRGLFLAAFFLISFNVLVWILGIAILSRGRNDIKLTWKKAVLNFGTVPCAIGFILYLLKMPAIGFELPIFVSEFLVYLKNLCTPLSVLILGALIAKQSPKQIFLNWKVYLFCIIKLALFPLLVCLITKLIHMDGTTAMFLTAAAALPAASNITMLCEIYDIDPSHASLVVGASSLLCVVSLPLVLNLAQIIFAM